MKKVLAFLVLAAVLVLGGCCSNPNATAQLQASLNQVQAFYGPLSTAANALVGKTVLPGSQDAKVQDATVAADSALLLLGTLQDEYCPSTSAVGQAVLQAKQAASQAQAAGVPVSTTTTTQTSQ
jgi:hypothetical protein